MCLEPHHIKPPPFKRWLLVFKTLKTLMITSLYPGKGLQSKMQKKKKSEWELLKMCRKPINRVPYSPLVGGGGEFKNWCMFMGRWSIEFAEVGTVTPCGSWTLKTALWKQSPEAVGLKEENLTLSTEAQSSVTGQQAEDWAGQYQTKSADGDHSLYCLLRSPRWGFWRVVVNHHTGQLSVF